jgi:serine/threonine-protein kinase
MLRDEDNGLSTTPILMDFGVAKIIGGTTLTGSGAVGTIEYMAPEQIISSRTIDFRADIYALGVLAYELLTGKPPFHGNVGQILFNQLQQPPPDPRTLVSDLPKSTSIALLKALAKSPDERHTTASAFIEALIAP